MIIWAGTSSKDVGMVVEHYPSVTIPQKKIEVQKVPGRNDDIVISTGAFDNYTQTYDAFLDVKYIGGLEGAMPKIVDWLLGHDGYYRLEDTYFPDVYRMAYYTGGAEFVSMFNEYGEGKLTFTCAPEKYLKSGEQPIEMTKGKKLFNPTNFQAMPIIEITGNGNDGILNFNGNEFTIKTVPAVITIDVKQHKSYRGSISYSSLIVGEYESLRLEKETLVGWSGGITSVKITPRWWTV